MPRKVVNLCLSAPHLKGSMRHREGREGKTPRRQGNVIASVPTRMLPSEDEGSAPSLFLLISSRVHPPLEAAHVALGSGLYEGEGC